MSLASASAPLSSISAPRAWSRSACASGVEPGPGVARGRKSPARISPRSSPPPRRGTDLRLGFTSALQRLESFILGSVDRQQLVQAQQADDRLDRGRQRGQPDRARLLLELLDEDEER